MDLSSTKRETWLAGDAGFKRGVRNCEIDDLQNIHKNERMHKIEDHTFFVLTKGEKK